MYPLETHTEMYMFSCSVMSDSFVTPWPVACQAPLSMGFPRQESWSGLSFPSPCYLPDPETETASLESPALAGGFVPTESSGKPPRCTLVYKYIKLDTFFNKS